MGTNAENSNVTVRCSAPNRSRLGAAESFSVYFDAESKRSNLATALRMFAKRNGRTPNQIETARIRQFLATQRTVDVVAVAESSENEKERSEKKEKTRTVNVPRSPQKVLVTPIRKSRKEKSAAFAVYFERSKLSEAASAQNERAAVQWFKRFNDGREPNDAELSRIRSFTKTDANELTEKEYIVPTYSLSACEDESDYDGEDGAEEAQTVTSAAKSSRLVTKQRATSYTLQFEGDAVG